MTVHDTPVQQRPHSAIRHADKVHAETVLIDWMLGNACSYACSYCPKALHDGSLGWQSAADIMSFYGTLKAHYVDALQRRVWIQFTGGEPTMHPKIIPLLDAASDSGFSVSLISNGSRTRRFWERIAPHLNSVILTYHEEFVEHSAFRELLGLLAPKMPVQVNVTLHPARFEATYGRAQDLAQTVPEATFVLKPLRVDFGTELYGYTREQARRMGIRLTRPRREEVATPRGVMMVSDASGGETRWRGSDLLRLGRNDWQGWICSAGLESLRIKADGSITRAVCGVGGHIGKLGEDVELPVTPVRCSMSRCACNADILISRQRHMGPVPG
ncbi:MAG: hypothetical protein AAF566_00935 [Pseudomonadota bacterium]